MYKHIWGRETTDTVVEAQKAALVRSRHLEVLLRKIIEIVLETVEF